MKTFPIVFEDEEHEVIQRAAFESRKTMKQFILEAIEDKIKKEAKKEVK